MTTNYPEMLLPITKVKTMVSNIFIIIIVSIMLFLHVQLILTLLDSSFYSQTSGLGQTVI